MSSKVITVEVLIRNRRLSLLLIKLIESLRKKGVKRYIKDSLNSKTTRRKGKFPFLLVDLKIGDRSIRHFLLTSYRVLRDGGFSALRKYLSEKYTNLKKYGLLHGEIAYRKWIKLNEWDDSLVQSQLKSFGLKPKISIVTPVYNIDPKFLRRCIESVMAQVYPNWELCLYDDASTKKATIEELLSWKGSDKRIKIVFGKKNLHIAGASNQALKKATGSFVSLLDNDDELSPYALFEVVKKINENPNLNFIYSDEDKISDRGKRKEPAFKPEWSPDLFLSQMYTNHLATFRKSIVDRLGGFRKGFEGSQDYDLVLRVVEQSKPEEIVHIPKVLYHWRAIGGSAAFSIRAKRYAFVSAKKAIAEHLMRTGQEGRVVDGLFPGSYRVIRKIKGRPKVTIIIPFRDKPEILKPCVESILKKTTYKNYEILLVNNQSSDPDTYKYLEILKSNSKIRIINYDKPFNYSAINNFAVKNSRSKYVVLLNNDTSIIRGEWLTAMLEHAQRKEVGAVGARLFYPDNKIQHAGVVLGIKGVANHAFRAAPRKDPGYMGLAVTIRNTGAVTAACLMTRREVYNEVGGLNEKALKVAFNDVDLCLKIRKKGYLIVYTPFAELYHYESYSRDVETEDLKYTKPEVFNRFAKEVHYMERKWKNELLNDPFYSPNLTKKSEDFSLKLTSELVGS